jgi:hypothetical protein
MAEGMQYEDLPNDGVPPRADPAADETTSRADRQIEEARTNPGYWVRVKNKVEFVKAMIAYLSGGAHMSMEGDLSKAQGEIESIPGRSGQETAILRRQTLVPVLDFVVLPLEPNTTEIILRRIVPRVGIVRNVIHLQIVKEGELQLGAYDNFHPDCVVIGPGVPEEYLETLVQSGLLYNYEPARADVPRPHG